MMEILDSGWLLIQVQDIVRIADLSFSRAKKQVRLITADQYTFAANSFALRNCTRSHPNISCSFKLLGRQLPKNISKLARKGVSECAEYFIFRLNFETWIFFTVMPWWNMSLTEEWVNYSQREEIILSSPNFLMLFEREWAPINTDWTQRLKLHLRQHWTECSVKGQKYFYVEFYQITGMESRRPSMSDTEGPKLYHNIFCKCLNWSKMGNYSFYHMDVKLLMKIAISAAFEASKVCFFWLIEFFPILWQKSEQWITPGFHKSPSIQLQRVTEP